MASISKITSDGDALLKARVEDAVRLSDIRSCPRFVGFLDERQQAVARAVLHQCHVSQYLFWGGYEDAERTILGVFPTFLEPDPNGYPLVAIGFSYRKGAGLTHRDFLGTLLSQGIKREKVGDILCSDGLSVAYVDEDMAVYLRDSIEKVGGEGVSVQCPFEGAPPAGRELKELRDTVASPRLDAVVKVMIGSSREEAARRIEAGLVSCNHIPALSVSSTVREGDRISIRGEGRFLVETLGPLTRKGRLFLTVKKYV